METTDRAVTSKQNARGAQLASVGAGRLSGMRWFPQFRWRRIERLLIPYVFLLPFLILFAAFFFLPFIYALSQSFYKEQFSGLGLGPPTIIWVGLQNYVTALHDPRFWDGVRRVILFGLVQIPVMMLVALALAMLMDSAVIRYKRFFRLAFFIPYAVPGVVATIMWGFFYSPYYSPIVGAFNALHQPAPLFLGPQDVLWSIANISTWEFTGYNMIIFYSALQAIPQEIYESGRLDGLSEVGIALRLKLPLILPALFLGLLFSLIGTLQLFNEPLILTRLSNSITSTYTPNIFAYNIAFVDTNYYYGGALAVILGVVTFAFSYGFLRLTRRQQVGG
ncbi:MAG TPA: sugar ABC transporter permease [Ktedonobacterales bacterium]|nr:sugar ABC transporter permease [Ktedonobacterales bacterium]